MEIPSVKSTKIKRQFQAATSGLVVKFTLTSVALPLPRPHRPKHYTVATMRGLAKSRPHEWNSHCKKVCLGPGCVPGTAPLFGVGLHGVGSCEPVPLSIATTSGIEGLCSGKCCTQRRPIWMHLASPDKTSPLGSPTCGSRSSLILR